MSDAGDSAPRSPGSERPVRLRITVGGTQPWRHGEPQQPGQPEASGPTTRTEQVSPSVAVHLIRSATFLVCIGASVAMLTPCAPGAGWLSVALCLLLLTIGTRVMEATVLHAWASAPTWTRFSGTATSSLRPTIVAFTLRNSWLLRPSLGLLSLIATWTPSLLPTPTPTTAATGRTPSTSPAPEFVSSCEGL